MGRKFDILLDMDGVLSDFASAAIEKFGQDPTDRNIWRAVQTDWHAFDKMWGKENWESAITGAEFWANLKPFDWTQDLYQKLAQVASEDPGTNLYFFSSYASWPDGVEGKVKWLRRMFGNDSAIFTSGHTLKHVCARPNAFLVDDKISTVDAFVAHGGHAYAWPSQYSFWDGSEYSHVHIQKVCSAIRDSRCVFYEQLQSSAQPRVGVRFP